MVMFMNRFLTIILALALGMAIPPDDRLARGFGGFGGGGFHGGSFGGGGFDRSSYGGGGFDRGGYCGGGFDRSSYGGGSFDRSSYGGGDFDRSGFGGGSVDRSSYSGGFDRGGDYGGASYAGYGGSVNRGQLNSFLGLPTDGGFHAASGDYGYHGAVAGSQVRRHGGGASARAYQGPEDVTVMHGEAGVQGAAIGPGGAAAGERFAGGTAIRTPSGNVYTHGTETGRGIATGPYGATAGRYATARTGVNGSTIAGRGYAAYGTRACTPTYCHGAGAVVTAGCRPVECTWGPALRILRLCRAGYLAADWLLRPGAGRLGHGLCVAGAASAPNLSPTTMAATSSTRTTASTSKTNRTK